MVCPFWATVHTCRVHRRVYYQVLHYFFSLWQYTVVSFNISYPPLVDGCCIDMSEPKKYTTNQEMFPELFIIHWGVFRITILHLYVIFRFLTLSGRGVLLSASFYKSPQCTLTAANNIPLTASRYVGFKSSPHSGLCQSKPHRYS